MCFATRADASTPVFSRRLISPLPKQGSALTVGNDRLPCLPYSHPMLTSRPAPLLVALLLTLPFNLSAQAPAVTVDKVEGEVFLSISGQTSLAIGGQILPPGTELRATTDGRVELSIGGARSLALGNGGQLRIESAEPTVSPPFALGRGAVYIDTRANGGLPRRDLQLQVGELKLRVDGAEAWAALNNDVAQVCLISGAVEAALPSRVDRLDLPGQCLSRAGQQSRWVIVPAEVLSERIALVRVRARDTLIASPAMPELRRSLPPEAEIVSRPPAAGPSTPPGVPASGPPIAGNLPPPGPVVVLKPTTRVAPLDTSVTAAATATGTAPKPAPAKSQISSDPIVPAPPTTTPLPPGTTRWSVVLASLDNRAAAEAEAARMRRQGLSVDVREYVRGDKRGYRVGHGRFETRADAQAAFEALQVSHPKISGWMANY